MTERGVFITGTDTGVGKTFVSCALARGLHARGKKVLALKPVAAGCEWQNDEWQNDDALALQTAAGHWQAYRDINPFALPAAIAPHIAAREHGVSLSLESIADHCAVIRQQTHDFCVIEGAGGFLVPLNETESFADIPARTELPVILVVAMRLGCINHALLTAQAIQLRGLRLLGWVANQAQPEKMMRHAENLAYLTAHVPAPLLAEFAWQNNDIDTELKLAEMVVHHLS